MEEIFAFDKEISLILYIGDDFAHFDIILNDELKQLGHITYMFDNDDVVGNLSYFIFDEYRENGYAKKALKLLIDNIYKLDCNDLYLSILPNNIASIKLAESQGALFIKKVKIPENYIFSDDGKYTFANMYKIRIER